MTNENNSDTKTLTALMSSLGELEKVIWNARIVLTKNGGTSSNLIGRLDSYDGVLEKQKILVKNLAEHIDSCNWEEITRHISLINGLSVLVRDDAKALLEDITFNDFQDSEQYC